MSVSQDSPRDIWTPSPRPARTVQPLRDQRLQAPKKQKGGEIRSSARTRLSGGKRAKPHPLTPLSPPPDNNTNQYSCESASSGSSKPWPWRMTMAVSLQKAATFSYPYSAPPLSNVVCQAATSDHSMISRHLCVLPLSRGLDIPALPPPPPQCCLAPCLARRHELQSRVSTYDRTGSPVQPRRAVPDSCHRRGSRPAVFLDGMSHYSLMLSPPISAAIYTFIRERLLGWLHPPSTDTPLCSFVEPGILPCPSPHFLLFVFSLL